MGSKVHVLRDVEAISFPLLKLRSVNMKWLTTRELINWKENKVEMMRSLCIIWIFMISVSALQNTYFQETLSIKFHFFFCTNIIKEKQNKLLCRHLFDSQDCYTYLPYTPENHYSKLFRKHVGTFLLNVSCRII